MASTSVVTSRAMIKTSVSGVCITIDANPCAAILLACKALGCLLLFGSISNDQFPRSHPPFVSGTLHRMQGTSPCRPASICTILFPIQSQKSLIDVLLLCDTSRTLPIEYFIAWPGINEVNLTEVSLIS